MVLTLLSRWGVATAKDLVGPLGRDEWWLPDLIRELGIDGSKMRRWIQRGWLHAWRAPVQRMWVVWADADELNRLRRLRDHRLDMTNSERYPRELITPKPRITYRIDCGQCYERWAYIAGEFGGGEWAIEQAGGVDNILDYSDYRVMLGIEHKSLNLSLNGFAEIGYVFGRQLQYQKNLPDQNLPSTMMARIGLSY
jgi:hypothetical protein